MKKVFFLFCVLSVFNSNAQTKKQFTITGKIDGIKTGLIYLNVYENSVETKDSCEIKDGNFSFKGMVEEAPYSWLDIKDDKRDYLVFYAEPVDMGIKGNGYPLKDWVVENSAVNASNREFRQFLKPVDAMYEAFNKAYEEVDSLKNNELKNALIDSLDKIENQLSKEKKNYAAEFVKKHPLSLISAIAIKDNFGYYSEATEVAPLYAALDESIKQTKTGEEVKKMLDTYEKVAIGKTAPEIIQEDTSGNKISLSSLRGKYVLVDFWASWCGPCRKENPNIVKAYHAYKDKGFTIFGVSYDKSKAKWTKAILKDELAWAQVSDLQGWQNASAEQYYIKAIPSNILLDKEGRIIAKNLFGKALQDKLAEIFK